MKVKYIGPADSVDCVGLQFKRGQAVEVDDAIAGHTPDPQILELSLQRKAALAARDFDTSERLSVDIAKLDHGSGLLAQDVWQAAATKKEADK